MKRAEKNSADQEATLDVSESNRVHMVIMIGFGGQMLQENQMVHTPP